MTKKLLLILLIGLSTHLQAELPINQVVLWGHKLHSHTHSYIHWAFTRAFEAMGYKTLWLDRNDNIAGIDFANTLFITEGQVDQNIPIRSDCWYILHNCQPDKYKDLLNSGHCIALQVYTNRCLQDNVEKVEDCIYKNVAGKIIYMPWATDLLPNEIDAIKTQLPAQRNKTSYFIGSIGGGLNDPFENSSQINPFSKACRENGITFRAQHGLSMEDNIKLIQTSYLSPALQGPWQVREGYIPCRIFKNISYGTFGITNSKTVSDLFQGMITYNANPYQLFFDAKQVADRYDMNELFRQMDFVRDHHTYINRIDCLLSFLEEIYLSLTE